MALPTDMPDTRAFFPKWWFDCSKTIGRGFPKLHVWMVRSFLPKMIKDSDWRVSLHHESGRNAWQLLLFYPWIDTVSRKSMRQGNFKSIRTSLLLVPAAYDSCTVDLASVQWISCGKNSAQTKYRPTLMFERNSVYPIVSYCTLW